MINNTSATEARRQTIDAIIEVLIRYGDTHAPILVPGPDDAAWLAGRERELREWLEGMSDSAIEFERLRLGSRLGEEIGSSLSDQRQKAIPRTERKLRQLLQKHPAKTEDTAYRQLRLYALRKGGPPRMERGDFHRLFSAMTRQ